MPFIDMISEKKKVDGFETNNKHKGKKKIKYIYATVPKNMLIFMTGNLSQFVADMNWKLWKFHREKTVLQ